MSIRFRGQNIGNGVHFGESESTKIRSYSNLIDDLGLSRGNNLQISFDKVLGLSLLQNLRQCVIKGQIFQGGIGLIGS